jgi:hypothetical protein
MSPQEALAKIRIEYERAAARHGAFNSGHEGYAVIREELDELWDEVKTTDGLGRACEEEVQVGCDGSALSGRSAQGNEEGGGAASHRGGRAMRLRAHGTPEECRQVVDKATGLFHVVSVSPRYPDRGASELVRVYLDIRLDDPPLPPGRRAL